MYKEISKDQFQVIMRQLTGKSVWLKIFTNIIGVDVFYQNFCFLHFPRVRQWRFGHLDYDELHEHQNILIDEKDISNIHRDSFVLPDIPDEQIIIELVDGLQIVLECGN